MPHNNPKRNIWWGPPKRFADRIEERKISWLELFYDLVYVAAISQVTHHFATHPTWNQLGNTMLIFSLLLWSWVNGTLYHDLHGNLGIRTRLLTLWQMLSVAAVAVTVNDAFDGKHKSFALSFFLLECLIYYLWRSTSYYDPSHTKYNIYYRIHYTIAAVLFGASYFTDNNTATVLWLIALVINLTPGYTVAPVINKEIIQKGEEFTLSLSAIERFGLFAIIMLGEVILGIVNGMSLAPNKSTVIWVGFIAGIIVAFLMWLIYFDMLADEKTKTPYKYMMQYIALHIPLLGSLGITGATTTVILSHIEGTVPTEVYWIFCTSISIFMLSIVGLTNIMDLNAESASYAIPLKRLLIAAAIAIGLLPIISNAIGPIALLFSMAIILALIAFIGTQKWVKYKMFNETEGGE